MERFSCTAFTETYHPHGGLRHRSTKVSDCSVIVSNSGRVTVSGPGSKHVAEIPGGTRLDVIGGMLDRGLATLVNKETRTTLFISNAPPDSLEKLCVKLNPSFRRPPLAALPSGLAPMRTNLVGVKRPTPADGHLSMPVLKKKPRDEATPLAAIPAAATASMTVEQRRVMSLVQAGKSVFFTGSAGTGKSHLLKCLAEHLPRGSTVFTATTGIAASHVSGVTIQSFSGISAYDMPPERLSALAHGPRGAAWRSCNILIIDEISMLDGRIFDLMDKVARRARLCDAPFGGVQLVLSGDFFQLPPVARGENPVLCFQSDAWRASITQTVALSTVHRQSDDSFVSMLAEIRLGRCSPETERALQATSSHVVDRNGVQATQLHTHNDAVDAINRDKLKALQAESMVFEALDSTTREALQDALDRTCPAKRVLELKVGAQVMLLKNLNVARGRANGARGVVVRFQNNLPVVRYLDGAEEVVNREKWTVQVGEATLMRRQVPLGLAWALSIHKSQGMSLDCVEVSLGRAFSHGQVYVALSRARSMEGLRVTDFDRSKVRASADVIRFYQQLAN